MRRKGAPVQSTSRRGDSRSGAPLISPLGDLSHQGIRSQPDATDHTRSDRHRLPNAGREIGLAEMDRKCDSENIGGLATERRSLREGGSDLREAHPGIGPTEIIIKPDDVILTEILAVLNLDKHQLFGPGILDAMLRPSRHIDRVAGAQRVFDTVEDHPRLARCDEPVFGTKLVELVAEPFTRIDRDPLDLVPGFVVEHQK